MANFWELHAPCICYRFYRLVLCLYSFLVDLSKRFPDCFFFSVSLQNYKYSLLWNSMARDGANEMHLQGKSLRRGKKTTYDKIRKLLIKIWQTFTKVVLVMFFLFDEDKYNILNGSPEANLFTIFLVTLACF